jgi:hypothetical protein
MVTRRLPMIQRIESGWVHVNDALSKQEQRQRRRPRKRRERESVEEEVRKPGEERTLIDLVV